jgi:hypothetical protein
VAKTISKRVSLREAVRYVGARLPAFGELAAPPGDGSHTTERDVVFEVFRSFTAQGVKGSLFDNLLVLRVCSRSDKSASHASGGKQSRQAARKALQRIVAIVDQHATDHAPKVASLIVWLAQCAPMVAQPHEGEAPAAYFDRLTRAVDKSR